MNNRLKPLEEQVVVVMGATSGIGRISALKLAQRGARVVVAARALEPLQALAEEIQVAGGQATAAAAEVSDPAQLEQVAARAVERYGRLDTWVHTAAVMMYASLEETRPEEFHRMVEVNLLGAAYALRAALPHLVRQGRGALIFFTSVEGKRSIPLQSAYAASKHALTGLLDALRMELENEKLEISVTNIAPSSINTPLFEKALTRLGVRPMPVPPIYQPELAAEAVLYAAEHPMRDIVVGGAGKSLALANRLSPRAADRILEAIAFKGQRSETPKPEDSPHNLFEHLEGHDRVHGPYSQGARSTSLWTWLRLHPAARQGALSLLAAAGLFSLRAFKGRG